MAVVIVKLSSALLHPAGQADAECQGATVGEVIRDCSAGHRRRVGAGTTDPPVAASRVRSPTSPRSSPALQGDRAPHSRDVEPDHEADASGPAARHYPAAGVRARMPA